MLGLSMITLAIMYVFVTHNLSFSDAKCIRELPFVYVVGKRCSHYDEHRNWRPRGDTLSPSHFS